MKRFRPQYRLRMLFALIAVISVCLSAFLTVRARRERLYRLRVAALHTLAHDELGHITVLRSDGESYLSFLEDEASTMLQPDDVVVGADFAAIYDPETVLSALEQFPSLRKLHFYDTRIKDAALERIGRFRGLEELDLRKTGIGDEGVRHLAGLRSMRVLKLSRTKISGAALQYLANMERLEELDLSQTAIDDDGVRHLVGLRAMRNLDLSRTRVSGAALAHLSSMAELEMLDLSGDLVDDGALHFLADLPELSFLTLRETRVTDDGLIWFRRLPSLLSLDLDGCRISDDGLSRLGAIPFPEKPRFSPSLSFVETSVTLDGATRLHKLNPMARIEWGNSRKQAMAIKRDGAVYEFSRGDPDLGF